MNRISTASMPTDAICSVWPASGVAGTRSRARATSRRSSARPSWGELCQLFLTERLGVDPTLVRYKEAWWEGGGNSGPCLEVVFGGAEAATLVFMQNRDVNGHRVPMDTTVVDTGYGLERLTWLFQGPTSGYEAVFGDALAYLKRATGAKRVDDKVLREYSKVAGMLKVEDLADIREIRRQTAERVGISVEDLVAQVSPLEALYTVCD